MSKTNWETVAADNGFYVGVLGSEVLMFSKIFALSATVAPPSLATNTGATATVSVPGVVLGQYEVTVVAPYDLAGVTVTAYVSIADTIAIRFYNSTAGTVALASGTWLIRARKVV